MENASDCYLECINLEKEESTKGEYYKEAA